MLRSFGRSKCWANNVMTCCAEMLRSLGQDCILTINLYQFTNVSGNTIEIKPTIDSFKLYLWLLIPEELQFWSRQRGSRYSFRSKNLLHKLHSVLSQCFSELRREKNCMADRFQGHFKERKRTAKRKTSLNLFSKILISRPNFRCSP